MKRPTIIDFIRIGEDAEVFEIRAAENAPIAGKTSQEATTTGLITEGMLVVASNGTAMEIPYPAAARRLSNAEISWPCVWRRG